jgi:hypothetical protein
VRSFDVSLEQTDFVEIAFVARALFVELQRVEEAVKVLFKSAAVVRAGDDAEAGILVMGEEVLAEGVG